LTELNRLRAQRDRLQTRRARLIDGLGRDAVRQRGSTSDLPRGVRAGGSLPAVTDEHFVDVRRGYAGAVERRPCRTGAKLSRMCRAKGAAVAAKRSAGGT